MTDNPVINEQMLDLTMDFINAFPAKHDQNDWVGPKYDPVTDEVCGTTCCFAGHALLLSGEYTLYVDKDDPETVAILDAATGEEVNDFTTEAAAVLGLTEDEADILFDGYNKREDLPEIIQSIKDGGHR